MREIRGKTPLKEMEERTGVSRGQLSEIETGRRFPSDKQLPALEREYGPIEDWYGDDTYGRRVLLLLRPDEEPGS